MTGQDYIDVIDELIKYRSHYGGMTIKSNGGTVRMLARKFNLSTSDVVTILRQMVADEQLIPAGLFGFDMTYTIVKDN